MNDSTFQRESSSEPSVPGDVLSREEVPRFGTVDIVEAFTAMRHEWRGQAKESRALTEQIQTAVTNLQSLESKLLAHVAGHSSDNPEEARQLALLIVETDHQLSRAVTAIAQWEANRQLREAADANAVKRCFKGMNRVARWFARPLWILISEQRSAQGTVAEHPATEGLNLVLGRLRRMMHEQGIERLDVQGRPFDANTMHAIGTVASTDCPSGHVAEQLSPAYYWQGRLIRFSDVRVATRSARG